MSVKKYSKKQEDELRKAAKLRLATREELDIDDNAEVHSSSDNGCFVQAWVWFNFAGTKWDKYKKEEII